MKQSKTIALFFSLMPGAGHMYLGLKKQGIELMLLFLSIFFVSRSLNLDIVAIFLPIIWFYSIFDARYKAMSEEPLIDSNLEIFNHMNNKEQLFKKTSLSKYIGLGLIFCGIVILINEIILPIVEPIIGFMEIRYIKTSFTSIILISIGIAFLRNKPKSYLKKGDDDEWVDAE